MTSLDCDAPADRNRAMLLKRPYVADPIGRVWAECDVLLDGGNVRAMEPDISLTGAIQMCDSALRMVDAEGLWLWPGLIDLHVHFREPGFTHKESIASGAMAAMAGGYTAVVCEPNTDPPLADVGIIRTVTEKARSDTALRVFFKAAMTEARAGKKVVDVEALAQQGQVVALSDDGDPVVDCGLMRQICRRAARVGLPICPHCEDTPRSRRAYEANVNLGFSPSTFQRNEAAFIERDARLAVESGVPVHFSHVSLRESLDVLEKIRKDHPGTFVTAEAAPHHLLLDDRVELAEERRKVNPPLRSDQDRRALCEALEGGEIDVIASDHAPHTAEEKRRGASGFIGVETSLALILTHFVHEGRLSPLQAAERMSTRPAAILGLPGGRVSPGSVADLVLIDPAEEWDVRGEDLKSRSDNTPFEGWSVQGRAVGTIIGGALVYARDSFKTRISD
ncbi:MAG: dihydroorotase [Planctomycetota bacterium]